MGAGAVIMGLLGLGLTLALASGRSKQGDDEEPLDFDDAAEKAGDALEKAGVPTEVIDDALSRAEETTSDKKKRDKTPKPPPAAPSKDWRGWMATKLMHAMQSQSVAVMLATANELQTASKNRNVPQDVRSLMIQGAAALRSAANDLREKAKPPPSSVVKTIPELKPKRRPKAKRKPKPKPKPIPEPELDTSGPTEEQLAAIDFTNRKTTAMKLNQHLKSVKKGSEDRDMVEEYQEQEGLKPDGKYGVETAKSLIQFNVVPAKPFYVGDAGNWQSYVDDKKDWNTTVDRMAAKDSDRRGQWLATKL